MFQNDFEQFLTTQKAFPFIKQLSFKYPVYIFGGFIRSYISNTPYSDIDILIDADIEDFKRDYPFFEEKTSLSNKLYLTSSYKGTKIDISFSENGSIYNSHYNQNYFFNILYYSINNSKFIDVPENINSLIARKQIFIPENKDLVEHLNFLEKNPINFIKMLRFYSQSEFVFDEKYLNFLRENSKTLLESLKTLHHVTLTNEIIKILSFKNSKKFFEILFYLFYNEEIILQEKKLPTNTPLAITLNFYFLQTNNSFKDDFLDVFILTPNLVETLVSFNSFFFDNHIIINQHNILFNNYKTIIKKQLNLN